MLKSCKRDNSQLYSLSSWCLLLLQIQSFIITFQNAFSSNKTSFWTEISEIRKHHTYWLSSTFLTRKMVFIHFQLILLHGVLSFAISMCKLYAEHPKLPIQMFNMIPHASKTSHKVVYCVKDNRHSNFCWWLSILGKTTNNCRHQLMGLQKGGRI